MRSWVGASWLRLRRENTGPRGPGGRGGSAGHARDRSAMSRFRPGRRKGDDYSPGESHDGDAYEGDPYDGEPYPAEPDRGAYPPDSGSPPAAEGYGRDGADPGRGSARFGAPRSSGRPRPPRFRKDEVLQPTSVISPR